MAVDHQSHVDAVGGSQVAHVAPEPTEGVDRAVVAGAHGLRRGPEGERAGPVRLAFQELPQAGEPAGERGATTSQSFELA